MVYCFSDMVLCIITIIFLHVQNYAMELLYFYLSCPAAENQGSERGNVSNEWLHSSQVVGAEFRLVFGWSKSCSNHFAIPTSE